jgi:hypothetical protein
MLDGIKQWDSNKIMQWFSNDGGKNNSASTLLEWDIDYWCGKEKKNVTGVLVGIGEVYGKLERRQKLNICFGESVATVSLRELHSVNIMFIVLPSVSCVRMK